MGNPELNGKELSGQELDRIFIRARATAPEPDEALMQRILRDALEAMPAAASAPAGAAVAVRQPVRSGIFAAFWSSLTAGFGGGGVVASLGAVAVIALFLGYSAPAGFAEDLMPAPDTGVEIEPVAVYFLAGG